MYVGDQGGQSRCTSVTKFLQSNSDDSRFSNTVYRLSSVVLTLLEVLYAKTSTTVMQHSYILRLWSPSLLPCGTMATEFNAIFLSKIEIHPCHITLLFFLLSFLFPSSPLPLISLNIYPSKRLGSTRRHRPVRDHSPSCALSKLP